LFFPEVLSIVLSNLRGGSWPATAIPRYGVGKRVERYVNLALTVLHPLALFQRAWEREVLAVFYWSDVTPAL
jgi:hypothetical protein